MRVAMLSAVAFLTGTLALLTGTKVSIGASAAVTSNPAFADDATLEQLARSAISPDQSMAKKACQRLRAAGPAGLRALEVTFPQPSAVATSAAPHQAQKAATPANAASSSTNDRARVARIQRAFDQVAGQRYGYLSKLYWYSDWDAALLAAQAEGKPILSLRLLGNLTDELSCANSRFFRITLYPHQDVNRLLRERFVLHWQSVRPVPRITIDFGDGRRIERTITGNSVHHLLDSQGRPVDAIPGLYSPKAFIAALERSWTTARECGPLDEQARTSLLMKFHGERLAAIESDWRGDLQRLGQDTQLAIPNATEIDAPMMKITDALWNQIAALRPENGELDPVTTVMVRKQVPARIAGRLALGKAATEFPGMRMVRNLSASISLDTVRNEYVLHRQIHQWFANGEQSPLDKFTERIYAEVFLTPSTDPWLGLEQPDIYSALPNNGVIEPTATASTR
jgi:hypothetical protein